MLALIFTSILMFILGMFMFFAAMDVCSAIDRAWTSSMVDWSHRHDYWSMSQEGVSVLVHYPGVK